MDGKQKILIILGPTATGKSDLAVKLAKQFNGEIISADSRQVYKGLDIGTGKITGKEMAGIPHHLLDVASPKTRFSVISFVKLANRAIREISSHGKLPIVCGGTGFYISALIDGQVFPDVLPNKELRAKLASKSLGEIQNLLKKADPIRYENIDKQNARRMIRAIEIAEALGKVPPLTQTSNNFDPLFTGLRAEPEILKERICKRLLSRMKKGMLKEVTNLHKAGLSWKRMEELGLEYRYLARHLQGKISKTQMLTELQNEIWHYARRQMTWFRKDKRIRWMTIEKLDSALYFNNLTKTINKWYGVGRKT